MLYLLVSCLTPPQATLETIITNSSGEPLPGAQIVIYDDSAAVYSSEQADGEGFVSLDIPPLHTFFAALSADDFITTSFTGYAGDGLFEAPEGTLYLRSEAELVEQAALFSACEATSLPSIDGTVRLDIPQQEAETLPLLSNVIIEASSSDNESLEACYAGENSTEDGTDASGSFAFFDLPEGLYTLKAKLNNDQSVEMEIEYPVFLPAEGNIPLHPLFFPLP